MLLDVVVQSPLSPEGLRQQIEDELPSFDVRAGTSSAQGGRYVSATSKRSRPLSLKVWFYDDEPGQFCAQVSGKEVAADEDDGLLGCIRSLLDQLGPVSDRG